MSEFEYENINPVSNLLCYTGNVNVYKNHRLYYQIKMVEKGDKMFLYLIEFGWRDKLLISTNIINEIVYDDYKDKHILFELEDDVKKLKKIIKSFERRKKIFNLVK